jgi:hypothetical protein
MLACLAVGSWLGLPTRCPYQEEAPVSPLLELGHDAVDNVRLGCDDVDSIHVSLRRAPVLETLNIWNSQDSVLA